MVPLGGGTDVWLWGTDMRLRLKCVRGMHKRSWPRCGPIQAGLYPGCISALYPLHRHRNKRVLRKGASVCGIHACNPSLGENEQEVLDL